MPAKDEQKLFERMQAQIMADQDPPELEDFALRMRFRKWQAQWMRIRNQAQAEHTRRHLKASG